MPTLWDALPSIAVVGGQVSLSWCKSFYDLESIIIVILLNVINVRNFSLRDRSLSVMFWFHCFYLRIEILAIYFSSIFVQLTLYLFTKYYNAMFFC
jgi:hypothetical protein